MKLTHAIVLASLASTASAFAPPVGRQTRAFFPTNIFSTEETTASSDSVMPGTGSAYDRLGVAQEKVALGIDPSEVLAWLGTYDDIVGKFLKDNKPFTPEMAAEEVDKFLMDAEMVNAYVSFEKRKAAKPVSLKEEAEATLTDPTTIATYAAWIIGGASFSFIRKFVIEPKFASGEWDEIHLGLPSFLNGGGAAAVSAITDTSSNLLS